MEDSKNNTIMEENFKYNERNKNTKARYLISKKKVYLLASNTDSVNQLIQGQINELTKKLIQYKSEYDKITRESKIKINQTEILEKKIKALENVDKKTKQISKKQKEDANILKETIDIKSTNKEEQLFQKKTLITQKEQLLKDILLIQRQIYKLDDKDKKLSKDYERNKFIENDIREEKNQINFKIQEQNQKNQTEKNEQDLQIEYYTTIIKQKYGYLEAIDEQKEKQKQIQLEAKNNAHDKTEEDKRHELELLMTYNQFLREKMKNLLKRDNKVEDAFEKIRDIIGTDDLNIMVDTILNKDKQYNYFLNRIKTVNKNKEKLKKNIQKLKSKLTQLKNTILTKEEESKKIHTMKSVYVKPNKKELEKKERDLIVYLSKLGDKQRLVELSYKKVIENINALKEYDDEHPIYDDKNNENDNSNLDTVNESKTNEEKKLVLSEENKNKEEIRNEENEEKKNDDNINNEEEEEQNKIVNDYKQFLDNSFKSFKMLFLCHSYIEFKNLMKEQGIDSQKKETKTEPVKIVIKKKTVRGRSTSRLATKLSRISRISKVNHSVSVVSKTLPNVNVIKEDDDDDDDDEIDKDKDIFKRFLEQQKRERLLFLKQQYGDKKSNFRYKK